MRDYKRFVSTTPEDVSILFGGLDFNYYLQDLIDFNKPKQKICHVCKVDKSETAYYRSPNNADGRTNMCKKCTQLERKQK